MHTTKRPGPEYKLSASTAAQLRALDTMSVGELAEQFRSLFQVPTRSRNKAYLRKRIAWRIQELDKLGREIAEFVGRVDDAVDAARHLDNRIR